ncbi:MAG: hypothetical protein HY466_02620, partial [Deltaproteobacteria bacterium]|nr:hypothetical protein [Deltaproteobacteria bacterium]
KDLETVVNLDPDHIAPSPLLPVQSPLFRIGPDEELKRKTMTREWAPHVDRFLRDKGYANYLHKNYAKQNRENITQLTYFYYVPYIGTGAAADSITGHNLDEIESYLEAPLAAKTLLREEKYWDPLQAARNMIMFPEGIDLPYFKRRFDRDLEELLEESQFDAAFNRNQSQEWFREGIFEIEGDHLRIAPQARFSKEGWLFYMTSV